MCKEAQRATMKLALTKLALTKLALVKLAMPVAAMATSVRGAAARMPMGPLFPPINAVAPFAQRVVVWAAGRRSLALCAPRTACAGWSLTAVGCRR